MTYEEKFDESYQRVKRKKQQGVDFFEAFYQRFLDSAPQVREKFKDTDMDRQQKMLKKSFYSLVAFYASGSVDSVLEKIAEHHSAGGLDIAPPLYDLWMECLIDTVREYDPRFNDEVELAWRLMLSAGITFMKFKYSH